MAIPRTLAIDVYVVGQQYASKDDFAVTTSYVATSTVPPMPGLVDLAGEINLDLITFESREKPEYNMTVNTIFTLKPFIFDRFGNPVQAIFATPTNKKGIVLLNPQKIPPKKENMHAKAITCMQLLLLNKNAHFGEPKPDRTYSYVLGIFLVRPGQPDHFISLDTPVYRSRARA